MTKTCDYCAHAAQRIWTNGTVAFVCTSPKRVLISYSTCASYEDEKDVRALTLKSCTACTYHNRNNNECSRITYPSSITSIEHLGSTCKHHSLENPKTLTLDEQRIATAVYVLDKQPSGSLRTTFTLSRGSKFDNAHITKAIEILSREGCYLSPLQVEHAITNDFLTVEYQTFSPGGAVEMEVRVGLGANHLELLKKYPLISVSPISRPNAKYNF